MPAKNHTKKPPQTPKPLVVGNWKMNGMAADLRELRALFRALEKSKIGCDVMLCPPSTLLAPMAALTTTLKGRRRVQLGGQNCHAASSGAHTGDVSAAMLKDAGARAVILGHSERRADYAESDKLVCAKAAAADKIGLLPIICVGETLRQRKAGETLKLVGKQLRGSLPPDIAPDNVIIAYEPVWAIGSGLTPTPQQVAQTHQHIRRALLRRFGTKGAAVRVLYGGSVKPDNAAELMAIDNVDGALVGGASLKAKSFMGIINVFLQSRPQIRRMGKE